jgi:hypothetical protein
MAVVLGLQFAGASLKDLAAGCHQLNCFLGTAKNHRAWELADCGSRTSSLGLGILISRGKAFA